MTLLQVEYLFLIFWIYAFAGWLIESFSSLIFHKKFVNRGFLLGPYCPIYGVGVVFITLFLSKYENDIVVLFFLSAILCGLLEYLTSYFMEKLFKARWWDYSNMKYNINGRICLETLSLFAIAGIFIIYVSNPLLKQVLALLPTLAIHIITGILFLFFFIDCMVSFKIMNSVKTIKISVTNQIKDNTDEISAKVKDILLAKSAPYRRILFAFPQAFSNKIKESKEKIEKTAQKVKENLNDVKEKANSTIQDVKDKASNTLQDAKERANNTLQDAKDKASNTLQDAKDKASNTLQDAKNKASNTWQETKEKANKTLQDVKEKNKENKEKFLKKYKGKQPLSLMKINRKK